MVTPLFVFDIYLALKFHKGMVGQIKVTTNYFFLEDEEKFKKSLPWLDNRWLRKYYLPPIEAALVIKEALDHIKYFSTL